MAKATITVKIPSIGEIEVTGNLATEDAINDLIDAVNKKTSADRLSTRDIQDNLDDASDSVDEFSDELDSAVRSQSEFNKKLVELTKSTARSSASFIKTTGKTDSMSDMVESAGEVVSGLAGGLAGLVPFIGEGTARLAEAATQAGFMLLSMAVGAIESFQELNRSIMSSGTLLDGGFSGFAAAADQAGIPVTAFGEAILANTNRLRLMAGGAPGGLARLSAGFRELREAQDENMADLYALGFTNTEVAAGMANVAIAAERAGKNLSSEQLAIETYNYMRNLRELNRLTGISAEEAMAQVEANRANLFVQNQLAGLGAEQRDAANLFIASMEKAGLGPLADFAMTGQYLNDETAMMATRMGPLADIMRQYFLDLESGADPEAAMARFNESANLNRDAIAAAMESNQEIFGQTRELASQFGYLGEAGLSITQILEAVAQGTDPLKEIDGENLSITMGELQQATNDAQAAIQSTFIEGLNALSGKDGAMTRFAESISGAAMGVETFRDAMLAVMRGDYAAAAGFLGVEAEPGVGSTDRDALLEAARAAQTAEIPEGLDPATADILRQIQQDLIEFRNEEMRVGEGGRGRRPSVGVAERRLDQQRQQLIDLLGPDAARELLQTMGLPEAASGNILSGPDTGYGAYLHGTEAVVPLPDGRTIPVSLSTDGLSSAIVDALIAENSAADNNNPTAQNFAASLDSSRSLPELVNISRNMLNQMTASTQKLEQMIRAMEQGNSISRNAAYARA